MQARWIVLGGLLGLGCPGDDTASTDDGSMVGSTTTEPATTTGAVATTTGASDSTAATDATTTTGGPDATSTGVDPTGDSTGAAGEPPTIESVTWTHVRGCMPGVGSDVTVVVTASDPDDDVATLVYSGSAGGCVGAFDAAQSTVLCPQAFPYSASATVTDPAGHSDTIDFMIGVCEDGSAP